MATTEGLLLQAQGMERLTEFWKSELGDDLRVLMSDLMQEYLIRVMEADPHAFIGIECIAALAKRLGDQELFMRKIQTELTRRVIKGEA